MTDFKPFNWDYFFNYSIKRFRKIATDNAKSSAYRYSNETELEKAVNAMDSRFPLTNDLHWAKSGYRFKPQFFPLTWFHPITPRAWFGLSAEVIASCDLSDLIRKYHLENPGCDSWVQFVFSYQIVFKFHKDWKARLLHECEGIPYLMQIALGNLKWKADCPSAYEITLPVTDKGFERAIAKEITKGLKEVIDPQVEEFFKYCGLSRYTDAMKEQKTKPWDS